jgi:hypothetical protein
MTIDNCHNGQCQRCISFFSQGPASTKLATCKHSCSPSLKGHPNPSLDLANSFLFSIVCLPAARLCFDLMFSNGSILGVQF